MNPIVSMNRRLDFLIEDGQLNDINFLSDWNCVHPFYRAALSPKRIDKKDVQQYHYVRSDSELLDEISRFHLRENVIYSSKEILVGNGSSAIISAWFSWLKLNDYKEIHYVPPIYFTFHFLSHIHGIKLTKISDKHLFEEGAQISLPSHKTVLIITDPIWYAGTAIQLSFMNMIRDWQVKTDSLIFVDGSFQNFQWENQIEHSHIFSKNRTFRLICPSKALATHAFRFAYLLAPEREYEQLDFILDNLTGSASAADIVFAKKCMKILNSKHSNRKLIDYSKKRYEMLIAKHRVEAITPNSGYFIFAKFEEAILAANLNMGSKYFEQDRLKGYIRVNLLSPAFKSFL